MHTAPLLAFTLYVATPFAEVTGSLTGVTNEPLAGAGVEELYFVCLGFGVAKFDNVNEDTTDIRAPEIILQVYVLLK